MPSSRLQKERTKELTARCGSMCQRTGDERGGEEGRRNERGGVFSFGTMVVMISGVLGIARHYDAANCGVN